LTGKIRREVKIVSNRRETIISNRVELRITSIKRE
jgi:hypothetical protein